MPTKASPSADANGIAFVIGELEALIFSAVVSAEFFPGTTSPQNLIGQGRPPRPCAVNIRYLPGLRTIDIGSLNGENADAENQVWGRDGWAIVARSGRAGRVWRVGR